MNNQIKFNFKKVTKGFPNKIRNLKHIIKISIDKFYFKILQEIMIQLENYLMILENLKNYEIIFLVLIKKLMMMLLKIYHVGIVKEVKLENHS